MHYSDPNPSRYGTRALLSLGLVCAGLASALAEILYVEDFNTDGSVGPNPRYTVIGGFKSEPPHDPANVGNAADQIGPVYWARNTEVSYVGVPAPTAGRRALLAWDGTISPGSADTLGGSPELFRLVENAVKWLAKDKAGARVVFTPNAAAAQGLADYLSLRGYVVSDDDGVTSDTAYPADVVIKAPGGSPSRFAQAPQGVLVFSALDHDDMLTSSIGTTATFLPGEGKITAPAHPVAAGVPATFPVATMAYNWNLMGDILPGGAITVATMIRRIPPTVASLADVEAMAAGTKQASKASDTFTELDFSDGSPGDWSSDYPLPGGATGLWGLVAKGKVNVKAAGRYSFALGMDDGARLRVDANRNGLGPEDNVIVEDAAGGHRARYGDVTFPAPGLYDFEVVAFNSGGAGSLEMSVSLQPGGTDNTPINSGSWELLGQTSGNVVLSGAIAVDVYVPTGPDEEATVPLLVLLNGPTDTPPGSVFGGGPFSGYEGSGFFAGAALNKWLPEPIGDLGGYRTVRLRPVNVAGKENVKVTVALAATFLDFETSDFLDIIAYPQGLGGPEVRLARFSAPSGAVKYFADIDHGNTPRLGLEFQDVTYDVPAGATSLVLEIRAATTWWNEIVGFDHIRITAGQVVSPPLRIERIAPAAGKRLELTCSGGTLPFLVQGTTALPDNWVNLLTVNARSFRLPMAGDTMVFRLVDATTRNVLLYTANLTGAAERPTPVDTPATGEGWAALEGDTLTWYIAYRNLKGPLTMAHIHGPAGVDEAAGVIVNLNPPTGATSGVISGSATVNQSVKDALAQGRAYFNLHTTVHGGGEIRGQLGAP
jgi:hypothetical protein